MDTGDTSESNDMSSESCQQEIVSAAELAGETGGISCTTFGLFSPTFLILSMAIIMLRRQL